RAVETRAHARRNARGDARRKTRLRRVPRLSLDRLAVAALLAAFAISLSAGRAPGRPSRLRLGGEEPLSFGAVQRRTMRRTPKEWATGSEQRAVIFDCPSLSVAHCR